jgi:hypothetical protein
MYVHNINSLKTLILWRDSNPGRLFLRRMRCPLRLSARALPYIINLSTCTTLHIVLWSCGMYVHTYLNVHRYNLYK